MGESEYKKVRLSDKDVLAVKKLFRKHFLKEDKLWIFGSRVNLKKKGGDIDLYVETNAMSIDDALKMRVNYIWDLEQVIGEQRIDVVINIIKFPYPLPIYQVAKEEGVCLL